MYKHILKPILFQFNPETAHNMLFSLLTFLRHSEASWLGISVLRLRSQGADFHESEAIVGHVVVEFSILVQAACQTDRIGEIQPEHFACKLWRVLFINGSHYRSCPWDMPQEGKKRE